MSVLGLLLAVAGCGFHLRGSIVLPPEMKQIAVTGVASQSPLGREIHQQLLSAGVEVVTASQATSELNVGGESIRREVATVDGSGKANSYALEYRFSYRVVGVGDQPISDQALARGEYSYDRQRVTASEREEEQLKDRLRSRAVSAMLRRVGALIRQHQNASSSAAVETGEPR